jgi:FAD/FMN-containing dehydrogenase
MKHFRKIFSSWGGRTTLNSRGCDYSWQDDTFPADAGKKLFYLPYGLGRSYGDSCLLDDGCQIEAGRMDHLIAFDPYTGVLRCEAGCTIAQILEFCIPAGWFVPVTPGTKFVTIGGCLANDVHGKNHHRAGTFGCFVRSFALKRSDGAVLECSSEKNPDLFCATIGGLGLTGLVLWVEFQLRKMSSPFIRQKSQRLAGVKDFFEVAQREDQNSEYSVAWLDASHAGKPRGLFMGGNHAEKKQSFARYTSAPRLSIPFTFPDCALRNWSIHLLNSVYYHTHVGQSNERDVFFDSFFYPLDGVGHWNKAYGKKGLTQYQFVVPMNYGPEALEEALGKLRTARQTSFLTVVKQFGSVLSPGMLSFPRPGVTVCFDLPHLGESTLRLLEELDETVFACQGALYPAKDARMSRESFEKSFPRHKEFREWVDPAFSSNFARRVGLTL